MVVSNQSGSPRSPASAAASRSAQRRALAALCGTEVVSYGVLYYAFPVLAGAITASTGWSTTSVTAAFSAGNLVGAVVGIPVGRMIDRYGPRVIMTAGSVLATAALVGIAFAPTFGWFLAAWLLAGVAMAGVFYPPAFAALTTWYGRRRVQALTTLTLAAGFASTIFAPLTAALAQHLSWRGVYLVLALILAVTTVPAHALLLTPGWPKRHRSRAAAEAPPDRIVFSRTFLLLVTAMTLSTFALYAVIVNLVPLLTGRGLSSTEAAWALGLGGVGQVAGRLGYRALVSQTGVRGRTVLVTLVGAATTLLLGVLPGPTVLLVVASVLAGAARGLFTLLEATIVSDHWGPSRFATLNGAFNAPLTAASAVAPTVGAAIAAGVGGGYPVLFLVLAGLGVLSAALAATTSTPKVVDQTV